MTRGAGDEQQVDQRGGGVPGNPDTFSSMTISKFAGMNTVSPRGSFGQPNLLENVVLDRMGGYAACPSPRDVVWLGGNIIGASPLDGVNRVFVKTDSAAHLVNLTTGTVTHTYATSSQNIAPYERGCVMTWDVGNPQSGIVAHTITNDGSVVATDLISKDAIQFQIVESDQYTAGGGGVSVITPPTADPGATVFEDSFDRPNGELGSDWSASSLVISGGKAALPESADNSGKAFVQGISLGDANWHQVSATLTEGGGLIFHSSSQGTYIVELTPGRSIQITKSGNVYGSLGIAPGVDPVRVEVTFETYASNKVTITASGSGLNPFVMSLPVTPSFGIAANPGGTVDLFRYSRKLVAAVTTPGTGSTTGPTTGVADSRSYRAGSLYGFDPRISHYVMFYAQPYSYVNRPKPGTTLNPRQYSPDKMRPIILYIPPFPNGIKREYKIVFQNPGNFDFQIYGASLPHLRPYTEYNATPVDKDTVRSDTGVKVEEGTLIVAIPSARTAIRTDRAGFSEMKMLYQALNTGVTNKTEPEWGDVVGGTTRDGEVVWLNRGPYFINSRSFTFSQYVARVSSPPVDYIPPEVEWNPISNDFGEWAQLQANGVPGGAVEVYRSKAKEQTPFHPHSFFPVGKITELHLARTWVVADAVWRSFASKPSAGVTVPTDIEEPSWETTAQRRTVYYSEPDTPWLFLERFINLPLDKSRQIVAMRSVGDYLVFLGDADAVVLAGDSEANFYVRAVDIPGGFSQETTAVYQGVLYYRGVGGIYRMSGGRAEKISTPIETLVPAFPQAGVQESMSIDDENARVLVRVSNDHILCYDILQEGWTVFSIPGFLHQIGTTAYFSYGGVIKALDAAPKLHGKIIYQDLDGGGAYTRKSLKSISLTVESDNAAGEISMATQVHRPDAAPSGFSPNKTHLVNQRTKYVQWRTPNRFGYAFDFMLSFSPGGAPFVVKPGIVLELYREGVIRKGY